MRWTFAIVFWSDIFCYLLKAPRTSQVIQWLKKKKSTCQCWRHRDADQSLDGKIPWSREWQPTPVFLLGKKSHGQRCLAGYSPWSCRVRHDYATEQTRHNKGITRMNHLIPLFLILLFLPEIYNTWDSPYSPPSLPPWKFNSFATTAGQGTHNLPANW